MPVSLENSIKEFTPEDEKRIVLALKIYYSRFEKRLSTTLDGGIVLALCHYTKFIDNSEVGRLYERTLDYMDLLRSKGFVVGMPDNREVASIYLRNLNNYLATR